MSGNFSLHCESTFRPLELLRTLQFALVYKDKWLSLSRLHGVFINSEAGDQIRPHVFFKAPVTSRWSHIDLFGVVQSAVKLAKMIDNAITGFLTFLTMVFQCDTDPQETTEQSAFTLASLQLSAQRDMNDILKVSVYMFSII